MMQRRTWLAGSLCAAATVGVPTLARAQAGAARVVVVGGGFGGGTVARYLRQYAPSIHVTLVEPATRFYTCPYSNLFLGGLRTWESLGHGYDGLLAADVQIVHATAQDIDAHARTLKLSDGNTLPWDKLVLSPGVDMRWNAIQGYDKAAAEKAPHAWKAGPQTLLLRQQMEAMPDGGTFIMAIPDTPYRCPPGPYERAAMVAHYFKQHKPRSKILLLDAKNNFSKKALFLQGWKALYGDMIEWVSLAEDGQVVRVDPATLEVETFFGGRHKADVLNVIPPQKAGFIADRAGVTDRSSWVPVKGETFESVQVPNIHVVGDASLAGPMPKSGFSANNQGKLVAAVVAAELQGKPVPTAWYANTCYSLIGPGYGIAVSGVYEAKEGRVVDIHDSNATSPLDADLAFRAAEARYGASWYASISKDIWDR